MKKKGIILTLLGCLLVGGAWIVSGMTYSTPASKDAFTRDFLDLEREAPEGYHVWVSKTSQYELFLPYHFPMTSKPANSYGRQGDSFEVWEALDEERGDEAPFATLNVRYYESTEQNVDTSIDLFLSQHSYKGEHEEIKKEEHIILYGTSALVWDETEERLRTEVAHSNPTNVYFAWIKDHQSDRILELSYTILCPQSAASCTVDDKAEETLFTTIMDSVRFNEAGRVKENE